MKTIKVLPVLALMMTVASISFGQKTKTETFKVSGNCGMCKSKIEKAAKEAGVSYASWDVDKKEITIKYNSSSTNTAKVQQQIAAIGYDNAGAKATKEAYDKLHGCCKYDRNASEKSSCCAGEEACSEDHKPGCCKDGKCTKEGHDGKDCCKKS
jgi:mercuric ion binding protein